MKTLINQYNDVQIFNKTFRSLGERNLAGGVRKQNSYLFLWKINYSEREKNSHICFGELLVTPAMKDRL